VTAMQPVQNTQPAPFGDLEGLTECELRVLGHVAEGLADKEIAQILGSSRFTVSKHVGAILRKMSAASRTQAAVRAIRAGLVR